MKQIIFNPVILSLILLSGLVYLAIGFHLLNRSQRWAINFEKLYVFLFILSIGGVDIELFSRLNPTALYSIGKTLPSAALQLGIYLGCLWLVYSRWQAHLQKSLNFFANLIINSPFFCLHLFWIFLCSLLSETPGQSLKATLVCLSVTIFFIYIGKDYSWQELFNLLLWSQVAIILLSLYYCLLVPSVGAPPGRSWVGVLSHKNALGSQMAISAMFIYLQSLRLPKYKGLCFLLIGLALFMLQQANSGMSKILLVILISLLGVIRSIRRLPPRIALGLMGFFLAIGVGTIILLIENAEYIIVEQLGKDLTLTGRTLFWPLIVNAINRHPLFGYGYQGFWQPWRGIDNPALPIRSPKLGNFIPTHSHNGFLDIGLDLGWLGLAFFIISLLTNIYYGVIHVIRNSEPESAFPLVILTSLAIVNITETGIATVTPFWIFYVMLTARFTMDNISDKLRKNREVRPPLALESPSQFNRSDFW